MKDPLKLASLLVAAAIFAGCTSGSDVVSEETIQAAKSEHEEQRQRQIHDEYWQAQMEREEAMQAARERARERQEAMRERMERDP